MPDQEKIDALVQLASAVSHDLNNIFLAIGGNLSFLVDEVDPQGEGPIILEEMGRTVDRGIELSENLQAFSGKQKLNRLQFDANAVVESVFATLQTSILRGIEMELDLTTADCLLQTDPAKFERLLEDLAKNAASAMNNHGRLTVGTITTALQQHQVRRLPAGSYVRLTVKDTGPGMTPEVAKRALDPAFSTHRGSRGWGLARSAGFVRQSGGEIVLTTNPGQGSTVEIFLPRVGE